MKKWRKDWNKFGEKDGFIRKLPYKEYLLSEYWAKLSGQCKERAGGRCQLCNSGGILNAHHRTYANKGNPRLEKLDLVCLCEKCHKNFHKSIIFKITF